MKSGFIAILGRPNVGKSTFLNAILSKRVSIVSPKPQTTRDDIEGILTEKDAQMVFIDTPGLFDSSEALDQYMVKEARSSLSGADALLYIVSAENTDTSIDDALLKSLKTNAPLYIAINKIDLASAPQMEELIKHYSSLYPSAHILQMSALTNFGLKDVKEAVKSSLREGPSYFPEGSLTDKDEPFMAKEEIRQELLHFLKDEVPHQSAVVITKFASKGDEIKIEATIFVEKLTQRGIVIGKNGDMIKRISMTARRNLEKQWKKHVQLYLMVRYEPEWRNKPDKLKAFGYSKDKDDDEGSSF